MAYGAGIFTPSETAYKDPNRFKDVLEAEGNKQAKYLASMDQFYAQLDEMTRQFDITTEQRERFFEEEMAFKGEELEFRAGESELDRELRRWEVEEELGYRHEELGWRSGESERDRELRKWEVGQQTSFGREQLTVQRKTSQEQLELDRQKFDLDVSESHFLRDLYGSRERRTQETHEIAKDIFGGEQTGIQPYTGKNTYLDWASSIDTYADSGYDPSSDWFGQGGGY